MSKLTELFSGGGGGETTPLGSLIEIAKPIDKRLIVMPNKEVFLKSGEIENDPLNYNADFWGQFDWKFTSKNALKFKAELFSDLSIGNDDVNAIKTNSKGIWVLGADANKAYRSTDNGETWNIIDIKFFINYFCRSVNSIDTDKKGIWVAVGDGGIASRSIDDGETWINIDLGLGTTLIRKVVTDGNGVWVAVGYKGKVSRSVDNGETWLAVADIESDEPTLTRLATDCNGVFIATGISGDVYRSTDSGATWTKLDSSDFSPPIPSKPTRCITTNGKGLWFIFNEGGYYNSNDNGASWKSFVYLDGFTDLPNTVKNVDDFWITSSFAGRLGVSTDNGATWSLFLVLGNGMVARGDGDIDGKGRFIYAAIDYQDGGKYKLITIDATPSVGVPDLVQNEVSTTYLRIK